MTGGRAWSVGGQGGTRRLAPALVISLLLHATVLALLRLPERRNDEPPLQIVLTGSFRQLPPEGSVAPVTPAAPEPPVPTPAQPESMVPPPPESAPASATAPAPAPVQSAPAPAAAAAEPKPVAEAPARATAPAPEHRDAPVFLTKAQWSTAPQPQDAPDASKLGGTRVVGRRLLVTLWIDDQGIVKRAEVVPYELRPEVAALLAQTVTGVHFTPASLEGKPVAAEVTSRLCFDDDGQLDTASEGCWRFGAPPPR